MSNSRVPTTAMVALSALVLALTTTGAAQSNHRIVKIDTGVIEGALSGEVLSFKGIPYAAPPVGILRWRAPSPSRHGATRVGRRITGRIASRSQSARMRRQLGVWSARIVSS
jgi:Carboxylesterase family